MARLITAPLVLRVARILTILLINAVMGITLSILLAHFVQMGLAVRINLMEEPALVVAGITGGTLVHALLVEVILTEIPMGHVALETEYGLLLACALAVTAVHMAIQGLVAVEPRGVLGVVVATVITLAVDGQLVL